MDLHVGEYVELADGSVGYIVRFYDSSDYAGLVRLERKTEIWRVKQRNGRKMNERVY